jgi:prepilin-type processing-associated H-X9-DG protein
MHSWRVLVLPWLGQKAIYDRYRFDEPWDGPNNRKLHDLIVPCYVCPSRSGQGRAPAYVAVIGPRTAWPGATGRRLEDVRDETAATILMVEVKAPSRHWMDPRDLAFDRMSQVINGPAPSAGLASGHPGGAQVLFVDGSVRFLKNGLAPGRLRALLTVDGGEILEDF